jgi:hypothetical protein
LRVFEALVHAHEKGHGLLAVDEAVIVESAKYIIGRISILPSMTIGRSWILRMPRMPDCSAFRIGVEMRTRAQALYVVDMRSDFSLFSERLAEACRAIAMTLTGQGALDPHQVCQIADVLDVSLDWLTGRSNVMDVMEMPEPEQPKRKGKRAL